MMNSEKVKEIKKALECQSTLSLPKCEKCDYKFGIVCKTEKLLEDALTLINELESENKELKKYRCDWLNSEKMHLQADMEDTEFELASSNKILKEVNKENQQLKDQVAELKKENEILEGTKGRITFDDRINLVHNAIEIKLKQFAESLKGQMNEGEYMGKKYKLSVFRDIDIDEALKDFLSTTV